MAKIKHIVMAAMVMLASASPMASALPSGAFASSSALAQGRWVKIDVASTGITQITYDDLRSMGFSNPEHVNVYGFGGVALLSNKFQATHPDDVKPVATLHDAERGRLLFYGEADRTIFPISDDKAQFQCNPYSRTGSYFLSESVLDPQIPVVAYNAASSTIRDSHYAVQGYNVDVANRVGGSTIWFDREITATSPAVYNFDSRHFAGGNVWVHFAMGVRSTGSAVKPMPSFPAGFSIVQDNCMTTATVSDKSTTVYTYSANQFGQDSHVKVAMPQSAPANFNVTFNRPSNNPSWAAIDYVYMVMRRYNNMNGFTQMTFDMPAAVGSDNVMVSHAPENLMVWNISNPTDVRSHEFVRQSDFVYLSIGDNYTANNPCRLLLFDTTADYPSATYAGEVANQNIHGAAVPDMVIITTASLLPQAQELADIHHSLRGLDVLVVTHDQVLNEFSSGTNHPMAYRRMAKMFYDRNPQKFRNILLYGDATWDPRHIEIPVHDALLTNHCDIPGIANNEAVSYCSDMIFGMLKDDYSPMIAWNTYADVNVGRIPARDADKAAIYNQKVRTYLTTPPPTNVFDNAMIISDPGDLNMHFQMGEEVAQQIGKVRPSMTITKAYELNYPRVGTKSTRVLNAALRALNHGCGYFFFTGHASDHSLGENEIWLNNTTTENTYDNPPFGMFATCNTFNFDRQQPGSYSIMERMLFTERGGILAGVGSARTVFLDHNRLMAKGCARAFYEARPGAFMGDVSRLGQRYAMESSGEQNAGANTLCYNFIGDPSLPMLAPHYTAVVTEVNGTTPSESAPGTVKPLNTNTIKGAIVDARGDVVESFNGFATVIIYDGSYTTKTQPPKGKETEILDFELDEIALCEKIVPVVNGRFTADIMCPAPNHPGGDSRIAVGADNSDYTLRALGGTYYATIDNVDVDNVDLSDTSAPHITAAYINTPAFVDDDVVPASSTFYAKVAADASGLNVSNFSVGAGARLILDGTFTYPAAVSAVRANNDGSYDFSMALSGLGEGRHTLTFSVADNVGNRSTRTVSFVVASGNIEAALESNLPEGAPAREDVEFALIGSDLLNNASGRVIVTAADGSTVFSAENVAFPYTWNLRDFNDTAVPDGRYTVHAAVRTGQVSATIKPLRFTVLKK